MRLSRTHLELFGVGLLVGFLNLRYSFVYEYVEYEQLGMFEMTVIGVSGAFLVAAIPFAYAYHLGREGRAARPPVVAAQFLAVGVVAGTFDFVITRAIQAQNGLYANQPLLEAFLAWFSTIFYVSSTLVLAGLAGVPLGVMYGRSAGGESDDAESADGADDADDADGPDEQDNSTPYPDAVRTDV